MNQLYIPIDKEELKESLLSLKEGNKLYVAEFESENGKANIDNKTFTFVKYLAKDSHIEGLDATENQILAELKDDRFDKITIKTDISSGFFLSKQDAIYKLLELFEWMYRFTKETYEEEYDTVNL